MFVIDYHVSIGMLFKGTVASDFGGLFHVWVGPGFFCQDLTFHFSNYQRYAQRALTICPPTKRPRDTSSQAQFTHGPPPVSANKRFVVAGGGPGRLRRFASTRPSASR
jgi:hypothetical protein